ncbi:MAG: M48 family metalloprotease [Syntrophobacterales bacterium]|nr:M48 family metalloprotease [Syntrophobacterales bacterium]
MRRLAHFLILMVGLPLVAGFNIPSLPLPTPPLPSQAQKAAEVVTKTGTKAVQAARPLSEAEEYYLGRAVAARLLARYPLYRNPEATLYVNQVGLAVARKSSRPNPFRGYHFAVLDTLEPNAFACPGGLILVTRGLIRMCGSEDELAAVLAHEVAHVAHKDGLNSISQARWSEVLTTAGTEAARQYGGGVAGAVLNLFKGAVEDVFRTLVVTGYSRQAEEAADREAVSMLSRTGYQPGALAAVLGKMSGGGGGIFRTHPPTGERLARVRALTRESPPGPKEKVRTERFQRVKF